MTNFNTPDLIKFLYEHQPSANRSPAIYQQMSWIRTDRDDAIVSANLAAQEKSAINLFEKPSYTEYMKDRFSRAKPNVSGNALDSILAASRAQRQFEGFSDIFRYLRNGEILSGVFLCNPDGSRETVTTQFVPNPSDIARIKPIARMLAESARDDEIAYSVVAPTGHTTDSNPCMYDLLLAKSAVSESSVGLQIVVSDAKIDLLRIINAVIHNQSHYSFALDVSSGHSLVVGVNPIVVPSIFGWRKLATVHIADSMRSAPGARVFARLFGQPLEFGLTAFQFGQGLNRSTIAATNGCSMDDVDDALSAYRSALIVNSDAELEASLGHLCSKLGL